MTEPTVARLTRDEAAARINGREYGEEITKGLASEMWVAGLVAIYGASDDLLEFAGAVSDEAGAYNGIVVHISPTHVIIQEDDELGPPPGSIWIEAKWSPAGLDASWLIESEAEGSPFDIMEDGELFCRGLVIDLHTAFAAHHKAEAIKAAAPELYAALKAIPEPHNHEEVRGYFDAMLEWKAKHLRPAIAKAEGAPPVSPPLSGGGR